MRPAFHFTPPKGWMNDPNGAVYIDGVYHLFYQHYPDDTVWGPMHWGHATSSDLIHFKHEEIALYPDDNGYVFSGSCVLDEDNISGFGDALRKPLIAIYTSHAPETGQQQQSIAYSLDYQHFNVYEGNPVIKNLLDSEDYKKDFRDPKVFKNLILGGYSMVLAVDHILEFYHTKDFKTWEKTGQFNPGEYGIPGLNECPDLIRMQVKGLEEYKYVLITSVILSEEELCSYKSRGISNSHVTQYFVGDFDGYTFTVSEETLKVLNALNMHKSPEKRKPLILDYGTDNYATVSFSGTEDTVLIGWGEHWDYAREVPLNDENYRGKMTIPRKAELIIYHDEYRLKQSPVAESYTESGVLSVGESMILSTQDGKPAIGIEVTDQEIMVFRVVNENMNFSELIKKPEYNVFRARRINAGPCDISMVMDNGYYEIFADEGTIAFSVMTY